jgi:hypothetical protein
MATFLRGGSGESILLYHAPPYRAHRAQRGGKMTYCRVKVKLEFLKGRLNNLKCIQ